MQGLGPTELGAWGCPRFCHAVVLRVALCLSVCVLRLCRPRLLVLKVVSLAPLAKGAQPPSCRAAAVWCSPLGVYTPWMQRKVRTCLAS